VELTLSKPLKNVKMVQTKDNTKSGSKLVYKANRVEVKNAAVLLIE